MVAKPGILEQCVAKRVAGKRSAQLREDILIAIVVEIGKGHAMSFLKVTETIRCCDVCKTVAAQVVEHQVRHQR